MKTWDFCNCDHSCLCRIHGAYCAVCLSWIFCPSSTNYNHICMVTIPPASAYAAIHRPWLSQYMRRGRAPAFCAKISSSVCDISSERIKPKVNQREVYPGTFLTLLMFSFSSPTICLRFLELVHCSSLVWSHTIPKWGFQSPPPVSTTLPFVSCLLNFHSPAAWQNSLA